MPKPTAVIIWDKCKPEEHEGGKCLAIAACPQRILKQEAPGEPPIPLGYCKGCGTCVTACPFDAIKLL